MISKLIILALAFPVGFLLAYLTGDELLAGRKYFKLLAILSLIGIGVSALLGIEYIAYTFAFITIVAGISHIKSFDKNWTKRRF